MTTPLKTAKQAAFALSIGFGLINFAGFLPPAHSQSKPAAKPTPAVQADRSTTVQTKPATPAPVAKSGTGAASGAALTGAVQTTSAEAGVAATTPPAKSTESMASQYRGHWSMFLHNPSHSGNSYIDIAPTGPGRVKWTFPAEGAIDSSPAIYKGVIYFGSDDGHVYAVAEQNGRFLWKTKLGDKVKSSPALTDTMLVVGCEDKKVYGINRIDGKILWQFETKDRVSSSPSLYEGVAYVGSWDGSLYALDVKSGTLKWQFPQAQTSTSDASGAQGETPAAETAQTPGVPLSALGRITSSPCIAGNIVLVGAHNGYMYALNRFDGKMLWQFRTGGKLMASPMVLENTVYFGSWDHAFYAVDPVSYTHLTLPTKRIV